MSTEQNRLIELCKQGNKSAQEQIYVAYKTHWFTICLRYLNNREDSLDVLQNALIKIYTKLDQFDSSLGHFKSWSSRIVVNESIMFQRKYWKREVVDLNNEVYDVGESSEAISNLTLEELSKVIQELPTGYKLVFNMYTIEGYSHKEIAEKLSISEGTSKSQLVKAKAILKKKLSGRLNEELRTFC